MMELINHIPCNNAEDIEVYISDCEVDEEHPDVEYEVWVGYPNGEWETIDYFPSYDDALACAQTWQPTVR